MRSAGVGLAGRVIPDRLIYRLFISKRMIKVAIKQDLSKPPQWDRGVNGRP